MSEPTKVGKVSETTVFAHPSKVEAESGGRSFAWSPDDAEQLAGLLIRAARAARAQGGCIISDQPEMPS